MIGREGSQVRIDGGALESGIGGPRQQESDEGKSGRDRRAPGPDPTARAGPKRLPDLLAQGRGRAEIETRLRNCLTESGARLQFSRAADALAQVLCSMARVV